jgi:hypothetical protein
MKNNKIYNVIFLIFVIIFLTYSLFDINEPLSNAHPGFITGQYSEYAINYLKVGYLETKLAQLWNTGSLETGKEKYEVYVHRPIGTSFLISLGFLTFGYHEWAARLVQVFFNLGTIIFIFLITKELWDKKTAVYAVFFLVFSPMFFYMRNLISPDALAIFFILGTIYFYVKWIKSGKKNFFYHLILIFIAGTVVDWGVNFIVPVIILHYFLFHRKNNRKILLLVPLAIFMFSLNIFHIFLVSGKWGFSDLYRIMLFRLNLSEESKDYGITLVGLLQHFYRDFNYFYTPVLFFLFVLFLLFFIKNLRKVEWKESLIILTFLSMLSYLFIFSNIYWIHDFLILFILPAIPILGAIMIEKFESIKMFKGSLKPISYILVGILLFSFLIYSYSAIIKIYIGNSKISDIVGFLSKNKKNVIISFWEHPQNFQLKFYLEGRKVYHAKDIGTFEEIINKYENVGLFIEKEEEPLDQKFKDYLVKNFPSIKFEKYTVFFLEK